MISIITIILFFIYTWGLGFTVTYFVKRDFFGFEKFFMNIGIGLGVFSILSIIMNTLRIPLDWKIFLLLSIIVPIYDIYKKYKHEELQFNLPNFKLTKSGVAIFIVFLIFIFSIFMYTKGAFTYPYLEDNDPWGHSVGVKYVALEKTAFDPDLPGEKNDAVLSYIDPYPPAYDILQGILHQTADDLNWSLKFFNALIISLGMIFFFFMAKQFLKSSSKALFATFIFASLPAYLSHFIWAHSLVITLFFPAVYCFEKVRKDRNWVLPTIFMVAGIWVAQNLSQPLKITTMLVIYLVVISMANGKTFWAGFLSLFGGMLLSQFWWMAMVHKYGLLNFIGIWQGGLKAQLAETGTQVSGVITDEVISTSFFSKLSALYRSLTSIGGSGTRAYSFNDFFIAQNFNAINNPIGIGKVVTILVLVGFLFILIKHRQKIVKKENALLLVSVFWLIFTFWGVNGQTFFLAFLKENGKSWAFSVARGPFRVWALLAIPVSLIAAEGGFFIINLFKKKFKIVKPFIIILLIIGIIFTSTMQKYEVNTAVWPTTGAFANINEAVEYGAWFNSIPLNSKVFLYSPRDKITIGFGAFSCLWCKEVKDFRENIIHQNAGELHAFLKANDYEYFVVNPRMDQRYLSKIEGYQEGLLQLRYEEISSSNAYEAVYQKEGIFVVFRVK